MNYQKTYDIIIAKAKESYRIKHRGIYYENHHIIPKYVDGNNNKENSVLLTPREHFICHLLLIKMYPKNKKILYAFYMMSLIKNKRIRYKVSSRSYANAKEQLRILLTSEETKQKRRNTIYKRKYSPEAIDKYLNSLKNTYYSPGKDPIIHISFKNRDINNTEIENLKQNMKPLKSF